MKTQKSHWKVIQRLEIFNTGQKDYKITLNDYFIMSKNKVNLEHCAELTEKSILNVLDSLNLNFESNSKEIRELINKTSMEVVREQELLINLHELIQNRPDFKEDVIEFIFRDVKRKVLIEKYTK